MITVICQQEFTGDDVSDMFLEERENQLCKVQEEKCQQQQSVPGIISPHDRPDEMQE